MSSLFKGRSLSSKDQIDRPQTYAQLIQKVGDNGKYQVMILIMFCVLWAIAGMILMGTPFFFRNHKFDCLYGGLITQNCKKYVCSLPKEHWKNFLNPNQDYIQSVATQIDKYFCQDQFYLDITQSATYLGAFTGYLLFSFVSDNFGRRKTLVLSWAIATAGAFIFLFGQNLPMIALGLFMIGGGSDAAVNMCFNFLGEVVEYNTRQKFSVFLQFAFPLGVLLLTTIFIWIHDWQLVTLILIVIPSSVLMFFIAIYIEQTPQFLLRRDNISAMKALNRIGKINMGIKNILEQADIENVKYYQVQDIKFHQIITPLDLCRFNSLRLKTISLCYIAFAVYVLYYGPALVIDTIGFDIYTSSYVIQLSEVISYIPALIWIQILPRKKVGGILFTITGLCSIILLFTQKPNQCDFCSEAIFQLFVVAIFRGSISLYFVINYIYLVEVFPTRVRALGCGVASSVGTLGSTITPIFLGIFSRNQLNPNSVFATLALLEVGVITLLPETLNKPLQDEIQQIKLEKAKLQDKLQ